MSHVYDPTECWLGEGPLWHPEREQLFWFDIVAGHLHTREGDRTRTIDLGECASAAGWIDDTRLIVGTETRLLVLDVETDTREDIAPLETDIPGNRSNDGRADPWGGFWISTMGKEEDQPSGAFYRFYDGEVRKLYDGIRIPNAICFDADRRLAYFVDTADNQVKRVKIDPDTGWPSAEPELFLDLENPFWGADGAVTDAEGNVWIARWNGWSVTAYRPDGTLLREVAFDAAHTSCPAFGGPDLTTLYCTTAGGRVTEDDRARSAAQGAVHAVEDVAQGKPEPRVRL